MTLDKPRDRKAIYVTIRENAESKTRTRTFSVYGATFEQVERLLRRAVSSPREAAAMAKM